MPRKFNEEEVNLIEEDKLLIMERVAKLYFGDPHHKDQNERISTENPGLDDIEYFYMTGELSIEDRRRVVDYAFEDLLKDIEVKDEINKDYGDVSYEDEIKLLKVIERIKSQSTKDERESDNMRTISKEDLESIKNILSTIVADEDSIFNAPTRPNSRCTSCVRDLTKDETNCVKVEIENNLRKITEENEQEIVAATDKNLGNNCEFIAENIFKRNDDRYSHVAEELSNSTQPFHDDPKLRFLLGIDQLQAADDRTLKSVIINQSKGCCKDVVKEKKIKTEIFEEVEVVDSLQVVDHYSEGFLAKRFSRNHRSSKLNKCIIEEKSFNFSKFKTPMKDTESPFFIDKKEVSVKIYQDGLNEGWNPTQVVYELCSQLQWTPPDFIQHDYSMSRGFHFGVSIDDYHFIPKKRGANKKLAKHQASSFFLHFLGFKFSFDKDEQSTFSHAEHHYSNDYRKHRPINYEKSLDHKSCKNQYNNDYYTSTKPNYKSHTEYTSNTYFSTTQQFRQERPHNVKSGSRSHCSSTDGSGVHSSVFARIMNDCGFLPKIDKGNKTSAHKRPRTSFDSEERCTKYSRKIE